MSGQLYMGESGPACIVLGVAELGATDLPTTCLKDHMVLVGFGCVGSRVGEELQREELPFFVIEDRQELVEKLRARGIETIVDGAHSFAQFDFKQKDLGCDYFGTSLHKWLYAPKGTGLLYVKRDKIDKIWPLMAAEAKQAKDIRKFEEIGTHSAAPKLAIGEALVFHNGIGGKRKEARLRYLSQYWMNKLKDVPKIRFNTSFDPNQSCAIANVHIEGTDPKAVTKYLFDKHHIFTVPIVHEEFQGIRITPNLYTTLSELDRFCGVMESIAKNGLPA